MARSALPTATVLTLMALAASITVACGGGRAAEAQTVQGTTAAPIPLEQAIVTGYRGAKPTVSVLRAVREGRVGGVILFADNVPTVARAKATVTLPHQTAASLDQPPLLVMVDQEGGDVKRLPSFPPTVSPARMGVAAAPMKAALANPAVLDPMAYALLTQRGFTGVTISDAFDTPAIAGR